MDMTQIVPTWAVVATVDEHPFVVQTFVAWHLHLGAKSVHLFFDRPDDPAAALFQDVASVHVTCCDGAYWRGLCKRRPDKHQIRQVRNATEAYRNSSVDWLLHCDADEYLWPSRPVADHLEAVHPWIDGAVVPVAERCLEASTEHTHLFGGVFRRPVRGVREAAGLSLRGLTGHAIGKTFSRVGQALDVSIHRPQRADPPLKVAPMTGIELLHFDGLTRLHWVYKLLRKADAFANHNGMTPSPHRQMQIDAVLGDPQKAFELHDQLKVLTRPQCADLARQGLLLRAPFDPLDAVQSIFGPKTKPDFAGFDEWLRHSKAADFPLMSRLIVRD
jgi:hypothetical protein